jgi:hypothetical protein
MDTIIRRTICGSLLVLSFGMAGKAAQAQVATPRPTSVSEKVTDPPKAAPAKPHKVWTDDDVTTLRTPADQYADAKASQQEEAAAAAAAAKAKADAAKTPAAQPNLPNGVKPAQNALANPKSTEEADKMIAWENRDVDAQAEYINKIQEQLRTASGPERDHLLAEKARMEGVLAKTQEELKALKTQKADLEKPKPQNQ